MKICSLYGAGFYYIPGTDMCLKVGGWVRAEYAYHTNGSSVGTVINDVNNRNTNNVWWRVRGYITADARNQTEYGTLRSYIAIGLSTNTTGGDNAANQFDANRAFIQFAGFTFGRAQSFFDFYSGSATSYFGFYPQSDTGDGGKEVLAYTAQFGNGFSASISAETRRNTQIIAGNGAGTISGSSFSTSGSTVTSFGAYGGWQVPDLVANLRVDQAWGSAQIMGALHQVNGGYYTTALENSGHPSDVWGWAVGAGVKLNAPFIGRGDYFHAQVNYTEGALRYLFQNPGSGNWWMQNGQSVAYGVLSDGVYGGTLGAGTTTDVQLTTAWGFNAAYEHFWAPNWRTSIHGGYYEVSYNSQANAIVCVSQGFGTGSGSAAVATAGCDNDWSTWWIGSRTQWNITREFYMGVDVAYQSIKGMTSPTGVASAAMIPTSTATTGQRLGTEDNWQVRFRVHRDFYP